MDHTFRMYVLQPADQLIRNHQHRLECESAAVVVEGVFQAGYDQFEYLDSVLALPPKPVDTSYSSTSSQGSVDLGFLMQQRWIDGHMLQFDGHMLQLDGHFFIGIDINS